MKKQTKLTKLSINDKLKIENHKLKKEIAGLMKGHPVFVIPKEILLCGDVFKIVIEKELGSKSADTRTLAQYDYSKRQISILDGQTPSEILRCLIHEIMHDMSRRYFAKNDTEEEFFVRVMENYLVPVLNQILPNTGHKVTPKKENRKNGRKKKS